MARAVPLLVLALVGCTPGLATARPGAARALARCEGNAARAVGACVAAVSARMRRCHRETGTPCPTTDRAIARATARLRRSVFQSCPDAATVRAVGYGPLFTPATLAARLETACRGASATIAARTFGGPQAALLATADRDGRQCLDLAAAQATRVALATLDADARCVARLRHGRPCDVDAAQARIDRAGARALAALTPRCAALEDTLGVPAATVLARAAAQGRCLAATALGATRPLALDCGPTSGAVVPPRGTWVQVVLDPRTSGTRCGDGGPYAFWLRLAPDGAPVSRAVVDLQGGGVCVFEADCRSTARDLFRALDDYAPDGPTGGWLGTRAAANPFADWTMLALPYCTQDVHAGGGLTSTFPSLTVHRYGAVNVRAALDYLRDVLWAELDATTAEGYRPDLLRVLFGGVSAGGFGTAYNYHYLLDDLGWTHTTAVPDSALGLDNGTAVGVRGLGALVESGTPPFGWGVRPFLPPYCRTPECAVVLPTLEAATSPRLDVGAGQLLLDVSNQVDEVQRATTFFPDLPSWIDATRDAYCATQALNGLRAFLPAAPTPIHGILRSTPRFTGLTADGTSAAAWLAGAVASPATVLDRVDEGDLADTWGAVPFPCPVD